MVVFYFSKCCLLDLCMTDVYSNVNAATTDHLVLLLLHVSIVNALFN